VRPGDDEIAVSYEGRPIATLRPAAPFVLEPAAAPALEEAEQARRAHPALPSELSDCLVCSPTRADGMRVTPGPLAGRAGVLATPYEPHEREAVDGLASPESVWGALDCPSYPAEAMLAGRLALLGRLTVHRVREIAVGEALTVVGWTRDRGRRSVATASVIIDAAGAVAASAEAVWVELG
jgi:hypothetical protein